MKKIFLGGLPKSVTDEKLRDLFASYGEISDFVVMKDGHTKESRGFGFIEFSTEEPVNQVLKSRPHIIDGREIEVRRAMPKEITHSTIHERTRRVFIGGLNYEVTEEALKNYYEEKFSKYGKVESVEVKRDRNTNQSRGFAFITFDNEDAVDAVLITEPKPSIFGRNCEVKKSEPRRSEEKHQPRRRARFERRYSPYEERRRRHDYDYDYNSPPRDYGRRSERRPPPYPRDAYYDRSPPRYRQYQDAPYSEQPSFSRPQPFYQEPAPHDLSGSSFRGALSSKPTTPSFYPRVSNPPSFSHPSTTPSMPPRQFDSGYRTYETNPF